MKTISKALVGTVAAGAMAMAVVTPAQARDRDRGPDTGEIIAGALILGGIAAVAASAGNDRDRYRDGRYDNRRYDDRRYNDNRYQRRSQRAVNQCIRAVERDARRSGYRFANVTQIRDVDRERGGWEVRGRLVVDGDRGFGRYDNYRGNRRGYNRDDSGRFTCDFSRGRVVDIDYRGIRGLR
ncbi:MAG: hypothetical protein WA954_04060 [Parerythrobacter sp.]